MHRLAAVPAGLRERQQTGHRQAIRKEPFLSDPVAELGRAPSRPFDEARLYRLQFLASMALVSALVLGLRFF
ncbi:hypothetical protein, partial [Azospirillum sp. B506]|uniref:hypothetical protein n=1 Tax=Azospirillum sp. B506 TaxID=137721 RepID=UPI0005B2E8D9